MKTTLCLLMALIFCSVACKRTKSPSPYTQLTYEETHCSDPWYADLFDKGALEASLPKWLNEKKGIRAREIDIKRTGPEASYLSCNSKNGLEITIGVSSDDVAKAEALGFRKK